MLYVLYINQSTLTPINTNTNNTTNQPTNQPSLYTDEEVRSRSMIEITSPQAFDSLGTPLPHGLYDPLLGPTESKTTSPCITCGNLYTNCPGHAGHIELCVPVYQPLTFPKLMQLLRIKCLNCHSFRLQARLVKIFTAKLILIDTARSQQALQLDDLISTLVKKNAINGHGNGNGNGNGNKGKEKVGKLDISSAASSIDGLLKEIIGTSDTTTTINNISNSNNNSNKSQLKPQIQLTSHERSVRRLLIKEFFATCGACKNCNNCGAFSPRLRQDNYNKIFQAPLSDAYKKNNMGQHIKIRPAGSVDGTGAVTGAGTGTGTATGDNVNGWDSDDSDMEDDDDNDETETEPAGRSTMSDDEDDDDVALLGKKKRQSTVSTRSSSSSSSAQSQAAAKASKPDKFMHALEVESQVKVTWNMNPIICSQVFGNAHCNGNDNGMDGHSVFFMRAVPVPPSRFRPPMIMGTMTVEHAQNHYLNKVLEMNDRLRIIFATVQGLEEGKGDGDGDGDGDEEKTNNGIGKGIGLDKLDKDAVQARAISTWIDLQTTVNCFIDSSKDPSAAAAQNVPNGIRQLLEKKEGIFRKHMMGKRVNFSCRSVISPDPYIGTNEIGIPLYFAKTLTYPTPVTALNVAEMRSCVIRGANQYPGARWVELPNGRRIELTRMQQTKREAIAARLLSSNGIAIVGRQLKNGDMVLMNRQVSFVYMRVRSTSFVEFIGSDTMAAFASLYASAKHELCLMRVLPYYMLVVPLYICFLSFQLVQ